MKMNTLVVFSNVLTLLVLQINGVEVNKWKLSREAVVDIEKQIQLQIKSTIKTVRTHHGDLYDCVKFYKQPAFSHPFSKNLTFIPEKSPPLSLKNARNKTFTTRSPKFGLNGGGCPDETVPIKRLTKENIMRAKLAHTNYVKPYGTRYARCSAQQCEGPECTGFTGVSASLAVYNPEVTSQQYSAAIMKLQMGIDSIETGWRVDPKLNGDSKTHLYIRTDAGDVHCFNMLCPGFMVTNQRVPVDSVLDQISIPGKQGYEVHLSISRDQNRNWRLSIAGNIEIGYWPDHLFQQPGLASYVEWGGEVFGPKGTPKPGMGSGLSVVEDTSKDAYYSFVKVRHDQGQFVDPVNLKCKAQISVYEAKDEGNVGKDIEYLIIYGGPETSM